MRQLPVDQEELTLSNGAILQSIVKGCEVCKGREEEIEDGIYMLEYEGIQVSMCKAHAQQLLEMDDDELEKQKGGFAEFLNYGNT